MVGHTSLEEQVDRDFPAPTTRRCSGGSELACEQTPLRMGCCAPVTSESFPGHLRAFIEA